MTTEAERLAEVFETASEDHKPTGYPVVQQHFLSDAASVLREQAAEIERLKADCVELLGTHHELNKANTLLRQALEALVELETRCEEVKEGLRSGIPGGEPVHPLSARLTWPMSTAIGTIAAIKTHLGE